MRCPRCESAVDEAAVRCPACRAPLQLTDEPPPVKLDRALDLDRRRSRTPVPASTPPPAAADQDDGDLGDLSFDAPADDGPWSMTAPPDAAEAPGVGPEPALDYPEVVLPPIGLPASLRDEADDWEGPDRELGAQTLDAGELDPGEDRDDDDASEGAGACEEEHVAAQRGKLLSLASIAIAGAAALVAVLSSR